MKGVVHEKDGASLLEGERGCRTGDLVIELTLIAVVTEGVILQQDLTEDRHDLSSMGASCFLMIPE